MGWGGFDEGPAIGEGKSMTENEEDFSEGK